MSNKKDLKHYVRYDGNHKIVPGSNIWSRNKPPKVGKWTEVQATECCNDVTPTCGYYNLYVTSGSVSFSTCEGLAMGPFLFETLYDGLIPFCIQGDSIVVTGDAVTTFSEECTGNIPQDPA